MTSKKRSKGKTVRAKQEPGRQEVGVVGEPGPSAEQGTSLPQAEARKLKQQLAQVGGVSAGHVASNRISEQEVSNLVRTAVRFFLFRHSSRPGLPIPRPDLMNALNEQAGTTVHVSVSKPVLNRVKRELALKFGLVVRELSRARGVQLRLKESSIEAIDDAGSTDRRFFVLESMVPTSMAAGLLYDDGEIARHGFLMVLLGILELAGGQMAKDELWHHFGKLGVRPGQKHGALGRVEELLDDFVNQWYINLSKQSGPQGDELTYSIGERGVLECSNGLPEFMEGLLNREEDQPEAMETEENDG